MDESKGLYPNTFQFHNFFVDEAMYFLTSDEFKVLALAIREIMGWGDTRVTRRAQIAQSIFVDGKKIRGALVAHGTGLSRPTVAKCLRSLVKYGILIQTAKETRKEAAEYALVFDRSMVNIVGLQKRKEEHSAIGRKRTQRVQPQLQAKNAERKAQVIHNSDVNGTSVSSSDASGTSERKLEETKNNILCQEPFPANGVSKENALSPLAGETTKEKKTDRVVQTKPGMKAKEKVPAARAAKKPGKRADPEEVAARKLFVGEFAPIVRSLYGFIENADTPWRVASKLFDVGVVREQPAMARAKLTELSRTGKLGDNAYFLPSMLKQALEKKQRKLVVLDIS